MSISIIVAADSQGGIGFQGEMPWGRTLKADLQRFKELTVGHTVIMGRKTFESIGKPLPNRTNIVLSKSYGYRAEGCLTATSLSVALAVAPTPEIFIIGGLSVYVEALPMADTIYYTRVLNTFQCDTYLPATFLDGWSMATFKMVEASDSNPFPMVFETYKRAPSQADKSFVLKSRARSDEQANVLADIEKSQECPFCQDNLTKYHTEPILWTGNHWLVTTSRWPYKQTKHHYLLISLAHAENLRDLPGAAGTELFEYLQKIEGLLETDSCSVFMRVGNPEWNGGSVKHLHVHLIEPDREAMTEPIRVKLGSQPKK